MEKIFLFVLFSWTLIFPQKYYIWESYNLPGEIQSWGVVSPDSIFIFTTNGTYWKSVNGGESWRETYGSLPSDLYSISVIEYRTFISCKQGNLKYSDDLGDKVYTSFLEEPAPIDKICGSPASLYALSVSGQKLYKSTDFGLNWKPLADIPSGTNNLAVNENGQIFISTEDEIFTFDVQMANWKSVHSKSPVLSLSVAGSSVAFISDTRFVFSRNGGATWDSLECIALYRDIYADVYNNFYFSVLLCNGTDSEVGLFSVDLGSGSIEQLFSKKKGEFDTFSIGPKILCVEDNVLLSQMEEYIPEYRSGFFPLHENNRWLYLEELFLPDTQEKGYSLVQRHVSEPHIINGKIWHSLDAEGGFPYYSYSSSGNILDIYYGGERVSDRVSFNIAENYMQPYYMFDSLHYQLAPLLDFSPAGIYSGNPGKSYIRNYFCTGVYENIQYVSGIGEIYHSDVIFGETSLYHDLLQANITDEDGNTHVYDKIKDPRIFILGEPHWETDKFHLRCRVSHEMILPADLDTLNFIDSVFIEYEISDKNELITIGTKTLLCDSISTGRAFYEVMLDAGQFLADRHSAVLSYHTVVKTKGIFPHTSETDWKDIPFSTVGVNNTGEIRDWSLSRNYPNPFNPATQLTFSVAGEARVQIIVYTISGEKLFTLINDDYNAGEYVAELNMGSYSSGVYLIKMFAEGRVFTQKILLLK